MDPLPCLHLASASAREMEQQLAALVVPRGFDLTDTEIHIKIRSAIIVGIFSNLNELSIAPFALN